MRTKELECAFGATTYRVETPEGNFDLRVGIPNLAFDGFLHAQAVASWGVVTAYNPGGVRREHGNPQRQIHLSERLKALGWACHPAQNVSDDGSWPTEPGWFLLQVSEKEVCWLAAEFGQLACVCGNIGEAPRLVWI